MASPYSPKPLPKNFCSRPVPESVRRPRSGPYSLAAAGPEDLTNQKIARDQAKRKQIKP